MSVVDGVTFPIPVTWIPEPTVVYDIGSDLLTICGASLDLYGYGTGYTRRMLSAGTEAVVEPAPKAKQLNVVLTTLYFGKPGQKQFTPPEGAPGKFADLTAEYKIEVSGPYPLRQGGQAQSVTDVATYTLNLMRDSFIVHSALRGVLLGGVRGPAGGPVAKRQGMRGQFHLDAMTPEQIKGGMASYSMTFSVQV